MSKYTITDITNFNNNSNTSEQDIVIEKKDIRYVQELYLATKRKGLLQDLLIRRLQDEVSNIVSSSRSIYDLEYFITYILKYDYPLDKNDKEQEVVELFKYLLVVYYYLPAPQYISSTVVKQVILDAILFLSIQKECHIMKEFIYFAVCSQRQIRDGIQSLLTSKISKYDKFIKSQTKEVSVLIEELNSSTLDVKESMNVSAALELALDLENHFSNISNI